MRRVGRQPCPAIPAAGVEPAAFSFSGRRSYRLSYTGRNQRRRQGSNLLHGRVAADRRSRPVRRLQQTRAGGGARTHFVRVTRAVPGPSSIAGLSEQPVLVSSQLDRGSEPPSPPEGLARRRSRASGGTRTRTRPFTGGVLDQSSCTGVVGQGWIAGYDPAPRRSRGRMQPLHHTHHHSRSSIS